MDTLISILSSTINKAVSTFLASPIVAPIVSTLASPQLQTSVLQVLLFGLVFSTLATAATFLYFVFYWIYIPSVEYSQPVYLQYSQGNPANATIPLSRPTEKVTIRRPFPLSLIFPARVEYPFQSLTDQHQKPPTGSILTPGQRYDYVISLKVPESDWNYSLGNFMVSCSLTSVNGTSSVIVAKGSRPGLLQHKTWIIRWLSSLYRAPLLAVGLYAEAQKLVIPCLEAVLEHAEWPSSVLNIELSNPDLRTYESSVKIHAHFTGLRYFMYHWPLSTALLGISSLMFWICLSIFVAWRVFLKGVSPREETDEMIDASEAFKKIGSFTSDSEGDVAVVGTDAMGRKILVRRRRKHSSGSEDPFDPDSDSDQEDAKVEMVKNEPNVDVGDWDDVAVKNEPTE
jgi:seipin